MIDVHRMAAMKAFIDRKGCPASGAAAAALALHPLDDSRVPTRAFEKAVRKESRAFARRTRTATADQLITDARDTLKRYEDLAREHGETQYIGRYEDAIAGLGA